MARITVEDCLNKIPNRYLLCHLAIKRTLMLNEGIKPLVYHPKNKLPVLALREIAAGYVTIKKEDMDKLKDYI